MLSVKTVVPKQWVGAQILVGDDFCVGRFFFFFLAVRENFVKSLFYKCAIMV